MMLTPEQLAEMRDYVHKFRIGHLYQLFTHIDAQQARIAELEAHLQLANDCQEPLFDELAEKANRIAELEQDAAAERERVKAICGDVIDEWFNCAGGADEVLRRIEEMESDK